MGGLDMRMLAGWNRRTLVLLVAGAATLAACGGGGSGSKQLQPAFPPVDPLTAAEVEAIIARAVSALDAPTLTVAVTDRTGRPLGVYTNASPPVPDNDNVAVALARTTSFFSNSQAPLSSRTVQFLSTFHFPPVFGDELIPSVCPTSGTPDCPNTVIAPQRVTAGIPGTLPGPLWQIQATNRGAPVAEPGLTVPETLFNPGQEYPRSLNLDGTFPSPGIVSLPGAVSLYKGGRLVGGVGVYGVPPEAAEFAALQGAEGFLLPGVPTQGAIFLVGQRLPFVEQTSRPAGFGPGTFGLGTFVLPPRDGSVDPFGYLIGPRGSPRGNFSQAEVERVVEQCIARADRTRSAIRLPLGSVSKVIIVVTDLDGLILAHFRMEDTLTDAVDVVPAKARTVVYYSRPGGPAPADAIPGIPPGTATTTTALFFVSQPFFPAGIDNAGQVGPLFDVALQNRLPAQATRLGSEPPSPGLQNGLIFFPGGVPLYNAAGELIGGLGVSGDGVENNDFIAAGGAAGFEPPARIRVDNFRFNGVRLPYLEFPRNPGR
jgi:uncharacterized protein GlcG (DUF336 family)